MSNLSNRLHAWVLNNEMIDTHFTEHGCDCVSASELLVQQDAEIQRLRRENEQLRNPGVWPRSAIEERAELIDENTRLRGLLREYLASPLDRAPDLDKRASEALGDAPDQRD